MLRLGKGTFKSKSAIMKQETEIYLTKDSKNDGTILIGQSQLSNGLQCRLRFFSISKGLMEYSWLLAT